METGENMSKTNSPKWATMVPLIGGSAFGCHAATRTKPLYNLSYNAFAANESFFYRHWKEIPVFLIDEDKDFVEQFLNFENMINNSNNSNTSNKDLSKWVIRIKLSREQMLDRGIQMDDIHFAIKNSLKPMVRCIYSDFNDKNLIFRVRLVKELIKNKQKPIDQTDEIYKLKNFQENILKNVVLKGIKNIPKIILRKIPNHIVKENGNYTSKKIWVLDTVGTNLKEVLSLEYIDTNKTYSNDIQEVYKTLGIEAARQCIFKELTDCFDGKYINYHNMDCL